MFRMFLFYSRTFGVQLQNLLDPISRPLGSFFHSFISIFIIHIIYCLHLEEFIYTSVHICTYNNLKHIFCVSVLIGRLWNIRIWIHIWIPKALFCCWKSLILRPLFLKYLFSLYFFWKGKKGERKRAEHAGI